MKRASVLLAAVLLSAAFASSAASAPLSVLTYNVGLLRVLGSDFVPAVRERAAVAPREIARFAGERSPDLIVLQEVWKHAQAREIGEALASLGYETIGPKACTLVGRESGLLVAVRKPLRVVEWSYARFAKSTFVDSLARKGVLRATVEVPGEGGLRFALLATHTVAVDTDRGAPVDEEQLAVVRAQALRLLSDLEESSDGGSLPALLVGDFNVGPGYVDGIYRLIAEAPGIREAGASAAPGEALHTWDQANPLVRCGRYPNEPSAKIDHVFLRDGEAAEWSVVRAAVVFAQPVEGVAVSPSRGAAAVPAPLSDHYGFLADLELEVAR